LRWFVEKFGASRMFDDNAPGRHRRAPELSQLADDEAAFLGSEPAISQGRVDQARFHAPDGGL
jgi:hypothetical protein